MAANFLIGIFVLVFIELTLILLVKYLKRDFQWLITPKDILPEFDWEGLGKFLHHGYDPQLGWVRKAGTSKNESVKTVGQDEGEFVKTSYKINEYHARSNPGHEHLPRDIIATYGDSFAFSRHVNDDQTWQWHLSNFTNCNVLNFGVGNYGLDQAYKRLKMEFPSHKSQIAIMMVVPETISRIVNIWKHYSEYGNTFGFKGRFVQNGETLKWLENPINSEEKFKSIDKYLRWIQENDLCFQKKFNTDLIKFPYTYYLIKNFKRNVPLLVSLLIKNICNIFNIKNKKIAAQPWELILRRNFNFTRSLYKNNDVVNLLSKIVLDCNNYVEHQKGKLVFVIVPYLADVLYIKKNRHFYLDLIKCLRNEVHVIDMAEFILNETKPDQLYVNDFYAAHMNNKGNYYIANEIFKYLSKNRLIRT